MELYSKNPPSIAPSKFEERAIPIDLDFFTSDEKANPEKKIGKVKINGNKIFRIQKEKPLKLCIEINKRGLEM